MIVRENVPLAPHTTLHVGGAARYFAEAHSEGDVAEAIAFARERGLPLYPLGKGSNVVVPDEGVRGLVLKMLADEVTVTREGNDVVVRAAAGASWDAVVDAAAASGAFGIENLAGIPGTAGGAAVQNIGAYGAELATTFACADVMESGSGRERRIAKDGAAFGYRTSIFRQHPEIIITRVTLRLSRQAAPDLAYPDLARAAEAGTPLRTPADIVQAVRAVRAAKFPCGRGEGTAGSFFKNPILCREAADELAKRFVGLPAFPQEDGSVKIPLAWLLDRVLGLNGHANGSVRLYEKQPLVFVARDGARAAEIDALAHDVTKRVRDAVGISIEREVETFGVRA